MKNYKVKRKDNQFGRQMWVANIVIGFVALSFLFAGGAVATAKVADWGASHQIQKPWDFSFKLRPVVVKREPQVVMSPIVETVIEEIPQDLTEEEQAILKWFGERHFRVARALAVCESGLDPLNINWGSKDFGLMQINLPTWEQPVLDKFGYTRADLLEADKNVEVAYWIWDRGDGEEGNDEGSYEAWVVLGNDCFMGNL